MNITIQGKVIDCYEKPIYVNKETGEAAAKKFAVQLLANQKLSNGALKKEIVDITIDEKEVQKYQSNSHFLFLLDVTQNISNQNIVYV